MFLFILLFILKKWILIDMEMVQYTIPKMSVLFSLARLNILNAGCYFFFYADSNFWNILQVEIIFERIVKIILVKTKMMRILILK